MADQIPTESLPPILQFGLVAMTFLAAAFAVWRSVIGKHTTIDSGTSTRDLLQGIYRLLGEQRTDNARFANEANEKADEQTDELRKIERNTDHYRPPPRR